MSREPSSPVHRYREALARAGNAEPEPAPPPKPKPGKRKFRVTVEPSKRRREQTLAKLTTTTEALTAEERLIVRGYRLSIGGPAAEAERRNIEREARP